MEAPFSTSVHRDQDGWVAQLRLGDGASLTKRFPTEQEARRYPEELLRWLAGREHSPE